MAHPLTTLTTHLMPLEHTTLTSLQNQCGHVPVEWLVCGRTPNRVGNGGVPCAKDMRSFSRAPAANAC